jgi:hypothetical protein
MRGKRGTGRGRGRGSRGGGRGVSVAARNNTGLSRVTFANKSIDQKHLNTVLARVPVVVLASTPAPGGSPAQAGSSGGTPALVTRDALSAALAQDHVRARAGRTAGAASRGGGRGGAVAAGGGRGAPPRPLSWNERRDLVEDIGQLDPGAAATAMGMLVAAHSGGAPAWGAEGPQVMGEWVWVEWAWGGGVCVWGLREHFSNNEQETSCGVCVRAVRHLLRLCRGFGCVSMHVWVHVCVLRAFGASGGWAGDCRPVPSPAWDFLSAVVWVLHPRRVEGRQPRD